MIRLFSEFSSEKTVDCLHVFINNGPSIHSSGEQRFLIDDAKFKFLWVPSCHLWRFHK